ncbi:hypothetical protein Ae201684P_004281 [Aphanomyces euteiches]|nr:hypothetical protein Ae201684P_004281 [Aphanomyces euteiches]
MGIPPRIAPHCLSWRPTGLTHGDCILSWSLSHFPDMKWVLYLLATVVTMTATARSIPTTAPNAINTNMSRDCDRNADSVPVPTFSRPRRGKARLYAEVILGSATYLHNTELPFSCS